VEDDIAFVHPPDQRVPGIAISTGIALGTVKVNADVAPVGDLEPVPLKWVVCPPRVDRACLAQPVLITSAV
jgi:hypothetical protein